MAATQSAVPMVKHSGKGMADAGHGGWPLSRDLAGAASAYTTGEQFVIDGGYTQS
jgi:hypothetical protein